MVAFDVGKWLATRGRDAHEAVEVTQPTTLSYWTKRGNDFSFGDTSGE